MAKKVSKSERLFKKYLAKMSGFLASSEATDVLKELAEGQNSYMRIDRLESSAFDPSWLDKIEEIIPDLGFIVQNPRQNTKVVTDLVPVELARKTNAESTRHLASHTQFIKDIDEHGNVIPSKILNIGHDDDLHTYENRFIATFIRKLTLFVEKRYEYIMQYAPLHDEEVLFFKNSSKVNNSEVEIEAKIKVKTEKEDNQGFKINAYLKRLEQVREYVLYFYTSPFMKKLKTERDVRNPILQTNIIRKNLKYHHCYEIYKFIEKYDSLGIQYQVDENYIDFDEQELRNVNYALLINYLTLKNKHETSVLKKNSRVYKPKIITSMDDENFVYGPLYAGPISFVRVDQEYQDYLNSKVKTDLPAHPNKYQKEYYSTEYAYKKENKADEAEMKKLLKRKQKDADNWEKEVQKIIAQREEEERLERERIAEELRREEEARLNEIRKDLVDKATNEFGEGSDAVTETSNEENEPILDENELNNEELANENKNLEANDNVNDDNSNPESSENNKDSNEQLSSEDNGDAVEGSENNDSTSSKNSGEDADKDNDGEKPVVIVAPISGENGNEDANSEENSKDGENNAVPYEETNDEANADGVLLSNDDNAKESPESNNLDNNENQSDDSNKDNNGETPVVIVAPISNGDENAEDNANNNGDSSENAAPYEEANASNDNDMNGLSANEDSNLDDNSNAEDNNENADKDGSSTVLVAPVLGGDDSSKENNPENDEADVPGYNKAEDGANSDGTVLVDDANSSDVANENGGELDNSSENSSDSSNGNGTNVNVLFGGVPGGDSDSSKEENKEPEVDPKEEEKKRKAAEAEAKRLEKEAEAKRLAEEEEARRAKIEAEEAADIAAASAVLNLETQPKGRGKYKKAIEKIRGRYILFNENGYYIDGVTYTKDQTKAHVFTDMAIINKLRNKIGGQIIRV